MSSDLRIFGYGSLLFEPELPEALLDMTPATLPGMRRSFNKISTGRGALASQCPAAEVPDFVRGPRRLSLVLGTESGPELKGFVLRYPESIADRVLELVNAREGFVAGRDQTLNDYLPTEVSVVLPNGQQIPATVWKTNPNCRAYVGDLPVDEVVAILRAATPGRPGNKAQGTAYLEGVRGALAKAGHRDDYLDRLSLAIKAS